jgi:predicted amidohydrolase YtcJ
MTATAGGLAACGLSGLRPLGATPGAADLVIHNAPVLTVDFRNSVRGAVALKGNRVLATGRDLASLQELVGEGTGIVDAAGRSVTPGLIDVHNHLVAQATTTVDWVDLIRCSSTREVCEELARWIVEHDWRPGDWVRGVGYMWLIDRMSGGSADQLAGPPLLTRWDLDQVVEVDGHAVDLGRYPIYAVQLSGHYASVNSLGLVKAKVMSRSGTLYSGRDATCLTVPGRSVASTFSPEAHAFGSFFSCSKHDGSRQVDGMVFHHYAMEELLARAMRFAGFPPLDEREITAALRQRSREFIRRGVTSIYDNNLRAQSMLDAVTSYPGKAGVSDRLRLSLLPYICDLDRGAFPAFDRGSSRGVTSRAPLAPGEWVRTIGYKLQIDAGTMTGFTWEPNTSRGDPTHGKLNLWQHDDLLEVVRELDRRGAQISVHVAGDKSLDWTLDAFEAARVGGRGLRHRIEHLPCVGPHSVDGRTGARRPLMPRVSDLGLVLCPQPCFILYYSAFFEQAFGAGAGRFRRDEIVPRMVHSIPYRSAVEAGVKVALSSDNPCVIDPSPTIGLWSSVHRRTRPIGNGEDTVVASYTYNHKDAAGRVVDERVDLEQALRGHTIDAAYSGFEDKVKGSLEDGKLADLVVWNRDIRDLGERVPVAEAVATEPVLVVIDGAIAYRDTQAVRIDEA